MEGSRKIAGRLAVTNGVTRRDNHDGHRPPRLRRQRGSALRRARGSGHLHVAARATNQPRASWFRKRSKITSVASGAVREWQNSRSKAVRSPKRRRGKEHRAAQRNARAKGPTRVTSRRAQVPRHVARGTSPAKRRAPCRRKRYARSTRARALVLSTTSEALSKRRHLRRHPDGAPPLSLERRRTRRTRHRPSPRSRRAWVT